MTNNKFFANTTINSLEDIRNAVARFKSFVFVDGERAQATAELVELIDQYNAELKNNAVGMVVNSGDILNALVPSIVLDEKTTKSGNARKRAVYNAVSFTQYRVAEKDGKHEIKAITKAVTIREVFVYLCELYANAHADRKVTKADREKARKAIANGDTATAFRLFMIGAYRFENVADKLVDAFAVDGDPLFTTDKPSKANAEKQIKATAKAVGLGDIPFKRIHALTLYKRAYTIDKYHQAKTADILDFMQDFIIASRYAKNGIDLPDTIDKGGLFAVEEVAKVDNTITF